MMWLQVIYIQQLQFNEKMLIYYNDKYLKLDKKRCIFKIDFEFNSIFIKIGYIKFDSNIFVLISMR